MPYYAVIDTNVLVSALLSSREDSATVQVVSKIFSGSFIPLISEEILCEYNEVLRRKKFHFSEDSICLFINSLKKCSNMIYPSPSGEILPDIKDLPFYEVTLEKQDNNAYLVTGNIKHFPEKSFVVTPREFLNILEKQKS